MDILKARNEIMAGKSIYEMNLRVVDYGRVSTDKDEQINSLENQVNFFNDLIDSVKSWTHVNSYSDEGISGTQVFRREQFLKMIDDARRGFFDLIITKEVSRFARNTIDSIKYTEELLKCGVAVLFLSDNINTINPDSEFRLTLMASMAQDEVRKLSERVKFGIKRSIKDGKLGGSSIYGYYKKSGRLIINDMEALAVKKLFNLYVTGEYGFNKISEILASDGYYTRKGKVFSDNTLKKMLTNPRYKGYYTANLSEVVDYRTHKKLNKDRDEWIIYKDDKGIVPAIVSEELWNKANEIYQKRKKNINKNVLNKEQFLENKSYTSKLICVEHNKTFIRCASGNRKNNPVWRCNEYLRHGLKGCKTPILYEKHLNDIFTKIIKDFLGNCDNLLEIILEDYLSIIKENNFKENKIDLKVHEYRLLKNRLIDMLLRNIISEEDFKIKNMQLEKEMANLNNRKDNLNIELIIEKLRKKIEFKLKIEENIGQFFNLFIDKVYISKVDGDRNNIMMKVIFRFKKEEMFIFYQKNEFVLDNLIIL